MTAKNHFTDAILPADKQGHIYHLDVCPSQIAETVITVGSPDRVQMVSCLFDEITYQHHHREFYIHSGWLDKKFITVLSTGIGVSNIEIVINELDALKNYDFKKKAFRPKQNSLNIIRLGTTGAIKPQVALGELIITKGAFGIDGLMHYYDYKRNSSQTSHLNALNACLGTLPVSPTYFDANKTLYEHFKTLGHCGLTLTTPGFFTSQGRDLRLKPKYKNLIKRLQSYNAFGENILNIEMETAALYGLSALLGHRAISISTVVANRATGAFAKDISVYEEKMILSAIKNIRTL